MHPLLDIGLVGAGAAAVCLLDALAQGDLPAGSLTIFEPSSHAWRGRPYRPDLEVVRVNATPRDMSVRAGDDGHFEDWITARGVMVGGPGVQPDPFSDALFVPRALYGDYLEQSARSALNRLAADGWDVRFVRDRVIGAEPGAELVLRTATGQRHEVRTLILGTGAGRPADLYGLAGTEGFVADPYPVAETLAQVDPDATVAVIGSGLTAVDVALSLAHRGHRGLIRFHSRDGVLPGVRQRPVHHQLKHFTTARFRAAAAHGRRFTLRAVLDLLEQELAEAGESLSRVAAEMHAAVTEDPVTRLRRNLDEVDHPSRALRIVQQAVPEAGPDVFPLLPEAERETVLARHHRALMSLCCPMPPASAAGLLGLLDTGRLELVPGLRAVQPTLRGFNLESTHRADQADVVVNAVNARFSRINGEAGSLVGDLARAGVVAPHPRAGIHVERATSRAVTPTGPQRHIYALGDLAAGSLFFTFGVQSLADRAVDIVGALASETLAVLPA
ncbi:FAD/NAD(P)-binding protein [Actinoplanes regularis]|uniref:FAD/NAD(P)-binding protein n=1 Tax=Actinoplanes regularis TaxID=52697 RepID=UPI0025561A28|nr:FAD/NAD(P)-binding protein [Actinoplanes regularis]